MRKKITVDGEVFKFVLGGPGEFKYSNPIRWAVRNHTGLYTDIWCSVDETGIRLVNDGPVFPLPWRVREALKKIRAGKKIEPFSFWLTDTPVDNKPKTAVVKVTVDDYGTEPATNELYNEVAVGLWDRLRPRPSGLYVNPKHFGWKGFAAETPKPVAEYLNARIAGEKPELPITFEFQIPSRGAHLPRPV